MIRFKLYLHLCLFLLCTVSEGGRQQRSQEDVEDVAAFSIRNVTGFNIFYQLEPLNHVTNAANLWRWKAKSNALLVDDGIKQRIINGIGNSLSVEFRVKVKKSSKVSLFRIVSRTEDRVAIPWFELLIDYHSSTVEIRFLSENMIPERTSFELIGSHNTWIAFLITLRRDRQESTASLIRKGMPTQVRTLTDGLSLDFPRSSEFQIGGRSVNSLKPFIGSISKGVIYMPGLDSFPISRHTKRTAGHSKRGALRKPSSNRRISSSLSDASFASRDTRQANEEVNLAFDWREEIRACRNDQRQMNNMLLMLKQSHSELEGRVRFLEACECRLPVCIAEDGTSYNHNDTWSRGECDRCRCHLGSIQCLTDRRCRESPCHNVTCANGGSCSVNGDSFHCSCRRGFRGRFCMEIDYCARSYCRNGARCEPLSNSSYRCHCVDGFVGRKCERRDWCFGSSCMNGGTCVNRRMSFECTCRRGFIGDRCERRNWCWNEPCLNGGECLNYNEGYRCQCTRGFVGDDCQYSDLCETNPCGQRGSCSSLVQDGSYDYRCDCIDGYTGKNCDVIDVCASAPCLNGGRCHPDDQSYACQCRAGFTGDRCEIRNPCFAEPCMNGASCTSAGLSFECACPDGFYGTLCEHRDSCTLDSCMNGGTCVPELGDYTCRCRPQFYGRRCQFTDYCRSKPCRNGAQCRNVASNGEPFTCDCSTGFTGSRCETVDVCVSNPCLHNGVCRVRGRSYDCACASPYMGDRCELVDYCSRNPCLNGGECRNEDRGFICSCPDSHVGRRCENPHPCSDNPCLNGGECRTAPSGGYTCTCPPSHYGELCNRVNHCFSAPCRNAGRCLNTENGYTCTCRDGFTGNDCSLRDRCRGTSCLNGGRCRNDNGTVICECPPTHQGSRCQFQCNICMYLPDQGTPCEGAGQSSNLPERRWYYNKYTQSCKSMQYSGCGGGNSNNFRSRQECRQRCIVGSCCLLQLSASPSLTCRYKSIGQCKRINVGRNNVQVVSFSPGERCTSNTCRFPTTCTIGDLSTATGNRLDMGCRRRCTCLDGGVLDCSCTRVSTRKEIRQTTNNELLAFQLAVRALKEKDHVTGISSWDAMRDEYMRRAPLAQSSLYFLLWNRAFLRRMELLLQKVNCRVTIPYYDFTMDAGSLNESIIWQPTHFGGDSFCVPDHPFRVITEGRAVPWQPCLVRKLNQSVAVPNMVDVALALSAADLEQLSANLFRVISYVRAYVGGDLATTACAYDPLFYPVHAFVDYLFSQWQAKHPEARLPQYSDSMFLGLPADVVWSGACVSYLSTGYSDPCNVSNSSPDRFGVDGFNLQGFSRDGFNRQGFDGDGFDAMGRDRFGRRDTRRLYALDGYNARGYNRSGYDRRGFNKYGFCSGYSRDGYDAHGFDRSGHNRYGLDSSGYDVRGYNIYGVSRQGRRDQSDFYDSDTGYSDCCFSRDGLTVSGLDKYGFSASGYNQYNCDYFFQGPFSLHYQHKLWTALSVQPRAFLITLSRSCTPLSEQPLELLEQNWMTRDGRVPLLPSTSGSTSHFSKKFCVDTEMLLSWCPCLEGNYPAVCHVNPCVGVACSLHPNAKCHVNMCGSSCSAEFFLEGRRVNCEDPCQPNPCSNGGTCVASRYSSASERFRCVCRSGFTGSLCDHQSVDTCILPLQTGSCTGRLRRWRYNHMTRTCEEFTYSGCGGNMNNFRHQQACQLRCSFGACCYRRVGNTSQLIGFDRDGYDKYGFNLHGYNRKGFHRSPLNSLPYGSRVLAPKGFGHDGYNLYGFNEDGYDRQGYNRGGYHIDTGYNRTGYDKYGRYDGRHGYDQYGLNSSGLSRDGFLCNGLNRGGYNHFGYYQKYVYNCESMPRDQCEAMSDTHEIIAFSIGQTCDEVECGSGCGCYSMGKRYKFGEEFVHGCRSCSCSLAGTVTCLCQQLKKRKEIRDLTAAERALYASAVRKMYESGRWDMFVNSLSEYTPQANGAYSSLPWHRIFLFNLESELQKHAGCKLTIPYLDWTIDVGSLNESYMWSASYFGGNGEPGTNCVNYHPFQGKDKWTPCIRRYFNSSISLPDAVDIHLLLKEPDFKNFSVQLQAISALFHLWVGGHLASPFAAYDPLFLSHWAFMDYLWTEWQKNNPHGMPRYPVEHAYTQLKPFDTTPDEVIASQQQLCVNYIPPTLGAPCNQTTGGRPLARSLDGFDRHGYDLDGYDFEGFDVNGRNRRGEPDTRRVFDEDGFTATGYHRSGFDSHGWDQYGYDRSNRNRDGIDVDGYDRSGYDKFGFDREGKTPFGMFRNGSFALGADRGYAASLFDRFGYNRFGFSSHGLDRSGYSAYGFNSRGYDEDNCNYFANGPHYMRFFFYGLTDLKKLPRQSLTRINRICKPITPLPFSIADGWLKNAELIRDFERQWAANRVITPSFVGRSSSVTSDRLWLPVTPDKQFCFNLQMFTGCPLDTPLVDCPTDLCQRSQCASHPQAQCRVKNCGSCYLEFFDGNTGELFNCYGCIDSSGVVHSEASEWTEECQSCVCQGGTISCTPPMCLPLPCSHPAPESNQCCPTCNACEYDGTIYRQGQSFRTSRCESCRCLDGSVTCRKNQVRCPRLDCPNPFKREGECCSSCPMGCEGHREGEQWRLDQCHTCTCTMGATRCYLNRCPPLTCTHPYKSPNNCCPQCSDCLYHGRLVRNRGEFMEGPCTHCSCSNGNILCNAQRCPRLDCINQVRPPNECCPVCAPGCQFEGNTYNDGDSFRPTGSPCRNCTCQNNEVVCSGRQCRSAGVCPRPVTRERSCCPECSDCSYGDNTYRNHQVWTSDDGCERCVCENGNIACETMYSCDRSCSHGVKIPGRCCMECSRCHHDSQTFEDGEVFTDERRPCHRCQCERGNVTCSPISCPPLQCSSQVTRPGDCCPSCTSCRQGSVDREHGATWRIERDACTVCTCDEGRIRCHTERCPASTCQYPVTNPNMCCPSCDGCFYNGDRFSSGDHVPTADACVACRCMEGNVICDRRGCEDLTCQATINHPGECCPRCATCTYEHQTYDDGSTFTSPRNPCLRCTCEAGEVTCVRQDLDCPHPDCANPGREHGQCCRSCHNCDYDRRNYRDGETFTPPGSSPCFTCTCTNGTVSCETTSCDAISCPNPVMTAGQCCPVCEVCVIDGVTYQPGDQWATDACTTCSCDAGRVVCSSMSCQTPSCTHPTRAAHSCCPTCDACTISGHVFSHAQIFRSPSDRCQTCRCDSGNVLCEAMHCEATSCASPVITSGSCCPTCSGRCVVDDDVTIENGVTIVHPEDSCQSCTCSSAVLTCERRCNPNPSCRHPTDGKCCRDSCDGCHFRGRSYRNGQSFPHSTNKCRRCTCVNGNVRCLRQRCPVLPCDNPQMDENVCCPRCPDPPRACTVDERSIPDGKQFQRSCQVCRCDDGAIKCKPQKCPRLSCSHPTRGSCCRECSGCTLNGMDYRNGESILPSPDQCTSCRCLSGNVTCIQRTCLSVSCTHPASDGCCPSCEACLYDGRTHQEQAVFDSVENTCDSCTCVGGSVQCERKACAESNCTHPVTLSNSCCPVCGADCLFEGSVYPDGFTFPNAEDQCRTCTCTGGSVVCQSKQCPLVSCRNPIQDSCGCSTCGDCSYNGVVRRNRETFSNPQDERCSQCYCQDGNVNCGRRHCAPSACTHPTTDMCDCPLCDGCTYHGRSYTSGQRFDDAEDTCNTCVCQEGNVVCESRSCSSSACANPTMDMCGCPVCLNCNYLGVEYDNNDNFIDSMNKCNQCTCRFGTVHCAHRRCPPVYCRNPVTAFGECCPECIGDCPVEGQTFQDGVTFNLPSNPCSSCTCNSGEVQCTETRCERTCSHPASENRCCPDCSGCLYQGQGLNEGEVYTPRNDPCQQCTCHRGDVICRDVQCPVPDCNNPITISGRCCAECPQSLQQGCRVDGQTREGNTHWIRRRGASCSECTCSSEGELACTAPVCEENCSHPVPVLDRCCKVCSSCFYDNQTYESGRLFSPNSCQDCVCRRGSVQCVTKACQPLSCPLHQQVQSRDGCCPHCASCAMGEHSFAEGESWTSAADECVTCQCRHGVITCQPIMCVPACQLMNNIPGRCCPVCSGCRRGSKVHQIGDRFEPNPMNPCEVCDCIATSDGSAFKSCHQVACPSLADCPRSCIRQPASGTCCPTCSNDPSCSYGNCDESSEGRSIHPSDNPCFLCQCNANSTWVCGPMSCPNLDCPQDERYTPKGSCCPVCDHCYLPVENHQVANGFAWRIGDCRSCHCDHGTIQCVEQECHRSLDCRPPMIPYRENDECCQKCVDPHATCLYEGHSLPSQHRWLVDKCTTCRCFAGRITCATQRCRMLMCNSDEVASVIPGECCPRCISKPATCIAFGDPHYRTFDGRMIHFQGQCRYLLSSDCMTGHFRIEVENTRLANSYGDVTWTDKVYLILANHRVSLASDYRVTINGTTVRLPLLMKPSLFIERTTKHILVNTEIGVQLQWNGEQRHLEVRVPGNYKRKTCGLCGNMNNFPQDDLRMRNSRMTSSDTEFGNNWKIARRNLPSCPDASAFNPCDSLPYAQRKKANAACKILRSDVFSSCHQVVNPEMYFAACVHDICACGENNRFCLCDALEAYASQCRRSDVTINWRSSTLCAITCPTERGYVFDECGSPCKRTCANRNLPPEVIDRQCYTPCVSGCQCVAGKVEHEGRCITASLCPDHIQTVNLSSGPIPRR